MSNSSKSNLRREAVAARAMSPTKSALTRSAILNAARQFLETRQFRELTVSNLMSDAGYSRAVFYQHFNDLHSLMETLLDEVKGDVIEGAQPWLQGEGNRVSSLQDSLRALVEVGYAEGFILKAVADAASSDARLEHVWETFLSAFDEVVAESITQDQLAGLTPEFDPYPVARALNRMDAGLLINAFGHSQKADKGEILGALLRIWLSTIYPFDASAAIDAKRSP